MKEPLTSLGAKGSRPVREYRLESILFSLGRALFSSVSPSFSNQRRDARLRSSMRFGESSFSLCCIGGTSILEDFVAIGVSYMEEASFPTGGGLVLCI